MKALEYFLSAYFNEDWALEAKSSREVARAFARNEPRDQIARVLEDLKEIRGSSLTEETAQQLLESLGSYFRPESEGYSAVAWLRKLEEWLSEGLKALPA